MKIEAAGRPYCLSLTLPQLLENLRFLCIVTAAIGWQVQASQEVVIHNFSIVGRSGIIPLPVIVDAAGNLYGTIGSGGTGDGYIYQLDTAGHLTVIHNFSGPDGASPSSGLTPDGAGNLYGTTIMGGAAGLGVVYKLDKTKNVTVLYSFTGGSDGSEPDGKLAVDAAGNIYGTALNSSPNLGEVFKLDAAGQLTVLYNFTGQADGGLPQGVILGSTGNLYGTTLIGGDVNGEFCTGEVFVVNGCGVVFKVDPTGHETVLYTFTGQADGKQPNAGLILDAGGSLYGTTYYGGTTLYGVVFKLDANDNETVLYTFTDGVDGGHPSGGLIRDAAGNFYSTTMGGGPTGGGVVFRLDTSGQETVLHSFTGSPDGLEPDYGVIGDGKGNLFGTTYYGGFVNGGTVYKIDASGVEIVLHSFLGPIGGTYPEAGLIGDGQGNLYGTTQMGGNGVGVVFKIDSSGRETNLHSFGGIGDGAYPESSLARDAAGNLYGTTYLGGANGQGTVYRVDPTGQETVLYSFTGGTDGGIPQSGVVLDAEGNFYGTTPGGGTGSAGVVYKLDAAGNFSVLYNFTGRADGGIPLAGLLLDAAGNLYGTTSAGGNLGCSFTYPGCGVVFKLDATGKETVLHAFKGSNGEMPLSGVISDPAGNLYGTTNHGGTAGFGTVYELSPIGQETVLYSFAGGTDGSGPMSGVILDPAGNLYGNTAAGGDLDACPDNSGFDVGCGVVYEVTPSGQETVLYTFTNGLDGGDPKGSLLRNGAGDLYGATYSGGSAMAGVLFKISQ